MNYLNFSKSTLLLLIAIFFAFQSCQHNEDPAICGFGCIEPQGQPALAPTETCAAILTDQILFSSESSSEHTLNNIFITEDGCLKINIFYGGGCGTVAGILVTDGVISNTEPPQVNLKFIHQDNDPCEAGITKYYSFDLNSLQISGANNTLLHFQGWPLSINYKY